MHKRKYMYMFTCSAVIIERNEVVNIFKISFRSAYDFNETKKNTNTTKKERITLRQI